MTHGPLRIVRARLRLLHLTHRLVAPGQLGLGEEPIRGARRERSLADVLLVTSMLLLLLAVVMARL